MSAPALSQQSLSLWNNVVSAETAVRDSLRAFLVGPSPERVELVRRALRRGLAGLELSSTRRGNLVGRSRRVSRSRRVLPPRVAAARGHGRVVVSMKDEWTRVLPAPARKSRRRFRPVRRRGATASARI